MKTKKRTGLIAILGFCLVGSASAFTLIKMPTPSEDILPTDSSLTSFDDDGFIRNLSPDKVSKINPSTYPQSNPEQIGNTFACELEIGNRNVLYTKDLTGKSGPAARLVTPDDEVRIDASWQRVSIDQKTVRFGSKTLKKLSINNQKYWVAYEDSKELWRTRDGIGAMEPEFSPSGATVLFLNRHSEMTDNINPNSPLVRDWKTGQEVWAKDVQQTSWADRGERLLYQDGEKVFYEDIDSIDSSEGPKSPF